MAEEHKEQQMSGQIMYMLSEGMSKKEIEAELVAKGYDEYLVMRMLEECIRLRSTRRRSQGMLLVMAGAICCFASFLLTISSSSMSQGMPGLFGLTSVGVVLVFAGLMYIFS